MELLRGKWFNGSEINETSSWVQNDLDQESTAWVLMMSLSYICPLRIRSSHVTKWLDMCYPLPYIHGLSTILWWGWFISTDVEILP